MDSIRTISTISGFAAKQFAVLTPFITLAMVAICAVQLSWMGWLVGLPPAEVGFGFIQAAAVPVAGGVALLAIIALCLAAIACFGGWCLSQPTRRFVFSHALAWVQRLLASLARVPHGLSSYPQPLCLSQADCPRLISSGPRKAALTAADFSGAAPLLL